MRLGRDSGLLALFVGLGVLSACSSDANTPQDGTGGIGGYGGIGTGGTPVSNSGGTPVGTGNTPGTGNVPVTGGGGASPIGQGGSPISAGGSVVVGGGGTPGAGGSSGAGGATTGGTSGAGGSSAGGMGGMSGGGGAGGGPADKPPCLKDSSQIVLIGDSYINWGTHTFPADINAASMLNWTDYAVGGTSMGSGGIGLIPPQFDTAIAAHPSILAVIMDGGGNDVLLPDPSFAQGGQCKQMGAQSPMIPDCQAIVQKAIDAGTKLFLHMADKGVKDVIYFFYPHVPMNTVLGGTDPNGMLDYALPKIQSLCENALQLSTMMNPQKPLRCHFVSLVPVFQGHMEYFASGDVHPNPTGSKAMAAAVWAKAKEDCVAQPASSGCCMPQ